MTVTARVHSANKTANWRQQYAAIAADDCLCQVKILTEMPPLSAAAPVTVATGDYLRCTSAGFRGLSDKKPVRSALSRWRSWMRPSILGSWSS